MSVNSFVITDSKTNQIRTDYYTGSMLIFDTEKLAKKHLGLVKPFEARENSSIFEVELSIKKVTQK